MKIDLIKEAFKEGQQQKNKLEICFVTREIIGPVRNGGLGTAVTAWVEQLVKAGHHVSVLYTQGKSVDDENIEYWIKYYKEKSINIFCLNTDSIVKDSYARNIAYQVYNWLRKRKFDIVHVHDWGGHGYYALLSKRLGMEFQNCVFCLETHGPTFWVNESHRLYAKEQFELEFNYMEKRSIELTDYLVGPSEYLLRWMEGQGWELPKNTYVHPYSITEDNKALLNDIKTNGQKLHDINEIVFFGRLENRKGVEVFCDALDMISNRMKKGFINKKISIRFLGKISEVNGVNSDEYIRSRSKRWLFPYEIISGKNQKQALEYIAGKNRLAVMPSLSDNSPNTVYETLFCKIPFIAASTGGITELINDKFKNKTLFAPDKLSLANKLDMIIKNGIEVSQPSFDFDEQDKFWVKFNETIYNNDKTKTIEIDEQSGVSICIICNKKDNIFDA